MILLLTLALLQDGEAKEFKGLKYRLFKPAAVEGKIPLVLFLHGAGERGDDNAAQTKHGVKAFVARQAKNPHILVAPQCPKNQKWNDVDWHAATHQTPEKPSEPMARVLELLDVLPQDLPIDPKRIYVTGLSMGGYGTWDLLARRPGLFAAAVPVCGGGDEAAAAAFAKVPKWIFHGDKDGVVKPERSRHMVEALKKAGGEPKYTEYPGVGHNAWDKAYADPALFDWLFAQSR
ncbi:MAG TPA: PHB depolymerase family esterase [Planctomycetota bacterium]